VIDVTFDTLSYGGQAIARPEGYVVFAKHAAPGDRAKVRVLKAKKNYAETEIVELVSPAAERAEPVCPLFGTCGGCSWQHLPIETQRQWKKRIVRDALRPLTGWEDIPVEPLVPSPDTWRYRNKMEFTFGRSAEGGLVAGFHKPANWREILDVEECWLAPESMERVLRAAVEEGRRQGCTSWDPRRHEGTLRHLVLRHSVKENALLGMLLTGDRRLNFDAMAKALFAAEPTLKGLAWGLNDGQSDVARASQILGQQGEETFDEQLGPYTFRISLASFFQTNTRGAERLYEVARDDLELTGNEQLLDAYCGTGTIGIYCARDVKRLYGIEIVQEAIWDARANAARNGIDNATFLAGDMRLALPTMMNAIEGNINRLVVDPPRGGMDKKALEKLLQIRAPLVAYVSCNPTTMARDLEAALAAGYRIEKVTPVDMFPQTYHVECVAKLRLPQP
jgi:23S rRNA (uracil1939-C5)-methyltransferase